jgi:hypothetical protein
LFLKLRSDTLDRIVKYDADLAFSLYKATEVDLDKLPPYLVEEQRNLDLRLSQKMAAENPELALRLARTALARGFSYELLTTLAQLTASTRNKPRSFISKLSRSSAIPT